MLRHYLLTCWAVYRRRKMFTAINLLCIVLTLVVLLVAAALFDFMVRPPGSGANDDRLLQVPVMTWIGRDGHSRLQAPLGYRTIEHHLRPLRTVERVAAVSQPQSVTVQQASGTQAMLMRRVDADYWSILDFRLLSGRLPDRDDAAQGRMVAVLSATAAARLFPGRDPVNRKIEASGQTFSIVGVVRDSSHSHGFADIWAPVTTYPSTEYRHQASGNFTALLLVRRGIPLSEVRAEVEASAQRFVFDDPSRWERAVFWADTQLDAVARNLLGQTDTPEPDTAVLVAGLVVASLAFMLMPALNLVNLNVGRILERSVEIGVRKSFGATDGQLALQFVVENILLCLVGGAISLGGAWLVLAWLERSDLIPYFTAAINPAVFGYAVAASSVFGLLSGVIPAWRMARLDPVHALRGVA